MYITNIYVDLTQIPPFKGILSPNKMICIKKKKKKKLIIESETKTCLLASKVTVIHQK